MDLLDEFIEYLRIKILSTNPVNGTLTSPPSKLPCQHMLASALADCAAVCFSVHRSTKICDVMLKNCGNLVHILLGQERFLYTLSKVVFTPFTALHCTVDIAH